MLAETVRAAKSPHEALQALLKSLADIGYRHARYDFVPLLQPTLGNEDYYQLSALPLAWQETYEAENLAPCDYVMEHCARFQRILPFEEIASKHAADELYGKQKRAWELGVAHGGRNGVALPLRDGFALSRGALCLISSPEQSPSDYTRELRRHIFLIAEIAEAFHNNLHRPWLIAAQQQLSPRETECLAGTMHGLRTKQIAHQLGTNAKTVEKQLAQARKRLSARTNVQAAVKAMVLGLIPPQDRR